MARLVPVARLDWLAKLGFAARGFVYIMLGWIALRFRGKADEGQNAVWDTLRDMPAGRAMLAALVIGLLAYAVYRMVDAALDMEGDGTATKAIGKRIAHFASGLAYCSLAYTAAQYLAQAGNPKGGNGTSTKKAAHTLLEIPLGNVALGLVGIGFFVAAAAQVRKAWRAKHMRGIASGAPALTCTIGRIGLVTRAAVFVVIGWSILRSAWFEKSSEVKALGGALATLRQNHAAYLAAAFGLILFGVFSLLVARYRVVPKVDIVARAKSKAAALGH